MNAHVNSLPKGTMLRGGEYDYRIEKVLGSGSFGITYLASYQDRSGLSIYVALKEFFMNEINGREGTSVTTGSKDGLFGDYRRKFAREAKNLTKLNHPNIIKVMEYFECNNTSYYTMEYLEGGSLDNYIEQHGALGESVTCDFAIQICEALRYMHSQGMLHLDLKPKNIMLRGDGSVVLIDYGLAKQYDSSGNPESSTMVGSGTRGYAPSEQADYQDGKGFPVTMDIYALGATIYKMLTAQTPPSASDVLDLSKKNIFPYQMLKSNNIDISLVTVVAKAMAPWKGDRYQNIDQMCSALKNNTATGFNNGGEETQIDMATHGWPPKENHIIKESNQTTLKNQCKSGTGQKKGVEDNSLAVLDMLEASGRILLTLLIAGAEIWLMVYLTGVRASTSVKYTSMAFAVFLIGAIWGKDWRLWPFK